RQSLAAAPPSARPHGRTRLLLRRAATGRSPLPGAPPPVLRCPALRRCNSLPRRREPTRRPEHSFPSPRLPQRFPPSRAEEGWGGGRGEGRPSASKVEIGVM